ncbi:complex I intermediate-associated protein CIA30 [Coniophora puteana RWD-64-598 SS2]|uniref:Complex I intermediate-associated protein CIA30 n=1 Tax=Coniophora puteana (strain RWD-64-598) TaxID=741705 RepID=A0A5M3MZY5_CONPW|nr:complex I intermediate-associated protein CIA30 [Coniophora puteana RWD-64-598 SS2]EIW84201.1 complex I intermediate-associated protein CIA30 [Coniophora puteana RWD-64-598 SS2]
MALSNFGIYLQRSTKLLRDNSVKILRMEGANMPNHAPMTLLSLQNREDISHFASGCDADIGGTSSVRLDADEDAERNAGSGSPLTMRFWGEMNLTVKPQLQGRIRGGYAGFRSKPRPTLFGELTDDVSNHKYLALRMRLGGSPRTRNSYFVNLQTDGPITTDLWQHRLYFQRNDGGWEDIFIPLENFVLTNTGEMVSEQIEMLRERVRTIGISLLGGNSGVSGPYDLGIASVRAVNEEDVTKPPCMFATTSSCTPVTHQSVVEKDVQNFHRSSV